jgi:adenosylcobinamide kinase/adenosylcobinamide-phosphate guanylyltransferase
MAVFITGGARSGKSDFAERYAMRLAPCGVYIATSQIWDEETKERVRRHRELRETSGYAWRTIEEPYDLAEMLRRLDRETEEEPQRPDRKTEGERQRPDRETEGERQRPDRETEGERQRPAVLVDCLTLWLTNWMLRLDREEAPVVGQAADSGAGIVPLSPPVRRTDVTLDEVTNELVEAVSAFRGPLLLVSNEVGSGIVPAYPLGRRFRDEAGRLNRRLAAVSSQAFLVVAGFPLDLKKLAFRLEDM